MQTKWLIFALAFIVLSLIAYVFLSGAHNDAQITPPIPSTADTADQSNATSTDLTLDVGETGHFKGLSITFNRFIQDSRCPVDVECTEAGAVNINVTFATASHTETKNMPSDEVPQTFDEFKISIANVAPPRKSREEINPADYKITFHIEDTSQH